MIFAAFVFFLLAISSGCVMNTPSEANLTADELADQYLFHAATITDYQSESIGQDPYNRGRFKFDYKKPSFARSEVLEAWVAPGSFGMTNGTLTVWYDADTRIYYFQYGSDIYVSGDTQSAVQRIVEDRNFTIIDRDTSRGADRYLIEAVTVPGSDNSTGDYNTKIRAWIEPSSGLAWEIMTYKNCKYAMMDERCSWSDEPVNGIQYESIAVNTGLPDSYFNFVPPEGSKSECYPDYITYIEPQKNDTSVPIDQPLPGEDIISLNERDSGRTITVNPGTVIEITLGKISGLDYRWIMMNEGAGMVLMNAGEVENVPENSGTSSGKNFYRWRFRAGSPGTETFDAFMTLDGCYIHGITRFILTAHVKEAGEE